MSWSDNAVSPCLYTPVAGEMTLDSGLSVVGGKIVQAGIVGLIEEFATKDTAVWDFSASANVAGGKLYFSAASWLQCNILKKTALSATGTYDVIWKFTRDSTVNHELYMGLMTSTSDYSSCVWATYNAQMYFRIGAINMMFILAHPANGTAVELRMRVTNGTVRGFYRFNSGTWVDTGCEWNLSGDIATRKVGITGIQYSGTPLYWESISLVNSTSPISAEILSAYSFAPTAPAKLATLPQAVLTLDGTGAAGTVGLYLQHYNDAVARWESYEGVADAWTLIGSYAATTTIDLPTLPAREGEMVNAKFVFTSTDGTAPAPSLVTLSLSWTSDVSAPVAPTIASILGVGGAGAVCDLGPVPATARHITAEIDIDGAGFLPLSKRNKIESGHGSMEFLGAQDADEQAGGRNSVQVLVEGLTLGNVVTVRAKAVDAVGNISSATDSDALTVEAPGVPIGTPALWIENAVLATGATGTIRVHLNGASADNVTVNYASADGTATDPSDYEGISGTITFTADDSDPHQYVDIAINATGDDPTSGTTAYTVVLSDAVNATIDNGTGTVSVQALDYVPVMVETAIVRVDRTSETRVEVSR